MRNGFGMSVMNIMMTLSLHINITIINVSGNNNIHDWFVYEGIVRPELIECVSLKSSANGKYYDKNEVKTWSWNGIRYNELPDRVIEEMSSKYNIYKDYTGYLENERPDSLRVA